MTSRARSSINLFVQKHSDLLLVIGALIVFCSFIVREEVQERYSSLSAQIETAQTEFESRRELTSLYKLVDSLRQSLLDANARGAGLDNNGSPQGQYDVRREGTFLRRTIAQEGYYINSIVNSPAEFNLEVSRDESFAAALPNSEQSRSLISILHKLINSLEKAINSLTSQNQKLLDLSAANKDVEDKSYESTLGVCFNEDYLKTHISVLKKCLPEKLANLQEEAFQLKEDQIVTSSMHNIDDVTEIADHVVEDISSLDNELYSQSNAVKRVRHAELSVVNWISIALFSLGWALGLLTRLANRSDISSS